MGVQRRDILFKSVASSLLIATTGCIEGPNTEARKHYQQGLTKYQEGNRVAKDAPSVGPDETPSVEVKTQYQTAADTLLSAESSFKKAADASKSSQAREFALSASRRSREQAKAFRDLSKGKVQQSLSHQRAVHEHRMVDIDDFRQVTGWG